MLPMARLPAMVVWFHICINTWMCSMPTAQLVVQDLAVTVIIEVTMDCVTQPMPIQFRLILQTMFGIKSLVALAQPKPYGIKLLVVDRFNSFPMFQHLRLVLLVCLTCPQPTAHP